MFHKHTGDRLGIRAMLPHSDRERLDAPDDQPTIERSGDGAGRVLMEPERGQDLGIDPE
jgi:hypothetical protein